MQLDRITDRLTIVRAVRQAEVGAARNMIERMKDRFDLYPERLAGDRAYGTAEMVGWWKSRGLNLTLPSSTRASATMAPSHAATSPMIMRRASISAGG